MGEYRLLDVNHRLCIPVGFKTTFRLTREDVIHRWYVPSLGMKIDAVPGKHNIFFITPLSCGVYYGICAELCGVNHSYMPIVVEVVRAAAFRKWDTLIAYAASYGKDKWRLPGLRSPGFIVYQPHQYA